MSPNGDDLTFDATTHTYRAGGRVLRSVTSVLRAAGYLDDLFWVPTADARRRGKTVHLLTHALEVTGDEWPATGLERNWLRCPFARPLPEALVPVVEGDHAWFIVPHDVHGCLDGFQAFRQVYRPAWSDWEHAIYHGALGVAGRPDRRGLWRGQPAVVEYKTGAEAAWHGLQLAGYDLLDPLPFPRKRVSVYFRDDGTFRVRTWNEAHDYADFLRAVQGGTDL